MCCSASVKHLMSPLPLKIIHLTTPFTTAVHRLVALMGFPGRWILRWAPENDCLFQTESKPYKMSSSGCTALLEISRTFFLYSEKINKSFVLLPQKVLAPAHWYTEEGWEAGAAIGLSPQETVSNCGTWVGALLMNNDNCVPAAMQERTFLGQKKSRMNSDVSQTWGNSARAETHTPLGRDCRVLDLEDALQQECTGWF